MELINRVSQTIEKHRLIGKNERVAAAVSGGGDSMALLYVLRALSLNAGFALVCLHFEHGIRGDDSLNDAEFVRKQAESLNIPFYMESADTVSYAKRQGLAMEPAARELRYGFFARMAEKLALNKVALAHHMNDQAETVLFHLIRGTGMKGLGGMAYLRGPNIIRPFLDIKKAEISAYLKENHIPYREDKTNACTESTRNYIRHEIIPRIEAKINPVLIDAVCRMSRIVADDETALCGIADTAFAGCARLDNGEARVDTKTLRRYPKAVQRRVVRRVLADFFTLHNIEYVHIDNILSLNGAGKSVDLKNGIAVKTGYGELIFINDNGMKSPDNAEVPFSLENETCFLPAGVVFTPEKTDPPKDVRNKPQNTEYFDRDAFPRSAVVRFWKKGDVIRPLGVNGSKKLSDYFSDKKVERHQRGRIPLVADGNRVIWAVGATISADVCITKDTKKVLKVTVVKRRNPGGS